MDIEALRLARAKAIRDYRMATGRDIYQSDEGFVAAIESADAALGVVSVPVEATEEMLRDGWDKIDWDYGDSTAWDQPRFEVGTSMKQDVHDAWSAMLAASPLREKPDAP